MCLFQKGREENGAVPCFLKAMEMTRYVGQLVRKQHDDHGEALTSDQELKKLKEIFKGLVWLISYSAPGVEQGVEQTLEKIH